MGIFDDVDEALEYSGMEYGDLVVATEQMLRSEIRFLGRFVELYIRNLKLTSCGQISRDAEKIIIAGTGKLQLDICHNRASCLENPREGVDYSEIIDIVFAASVDLEIDEVSLAEPGMAFYRDGVLLSTCSKATTGCVIAI